MKTTAQAIDEGIQFAIAGNYEDAIPLYKQALADEECPNRECVHRNLGLSFAAIGSHEDAVLQFDAAIEIYASTPQILNAREHVQLYYDKASSHYALTQHDFVILTTEQGLQLDNGRNYVNSDSFHLLKSYSLYMKGRYSEAFGSLSQAELDNPAHEAHVTEEKIKVLTDWGNFAARCQEDSHFDRAEREYKAVIGAYKAVISSNPENAYAHEGLGDVFSSKGNDRAALASYTAAKELTTGENETLDEKIGVAEDAVKALDRKERLAAAKKSGTRPADSKLSKSGGAVEHQGKVVEGGRAQSPVKELV